MGIHQALIGSYPPAAYDWEIANYGVGFFTIPASSLQANDLIVFALGSDGGSQGLTTSISTTSLISASTNSIEVDIEYAVVPATPVDITGFTNCDYALIMGFRRSGSTSSYNVSIEASNTTTTSPSHNNTAVSFSENDLALLLAYVDDDGTPMTPPTGSTKISEDQNASSGSIGAGYKQIDTAGNYSWGSWTTTGADNTVAYVIKIQEA